MFGLKSPSSTIWAVLALMVLTLASCGGATTSSGSDAAHPPGKDPTARSESTEPMGTGAGTGSAYSTTPGQKRPGRLTTQLLTVSESLPHERMVILMQGRLGELEDCYRQQREVPLADVPPLRLSLEIESTAAVLSATYEGGTEAVGKCLVARSTRKGFFNIDLALGTGGKVSFLLRWTGDE